MYTVIAALSAMLAFGGAPQDNRQAFLGIFAETTYTKMAGMPAIPEFKLPPGIKLPPQALASMMMFKPHRTLTVRLWSPGIAPEGATASLAVPEGLKLGKTLDLELYRPKPEEGQAEGSVLPGKVQLSEFTLKRYWGSSPTVKAGQPEVFEFKNITPEQQAQMREQAAKMNRSSSYFYKPDWTTGYWPAKNNPGGVEEDAALTGPFALTSSYTGNVALDVPAEVNFLAPIEMSSPNLEKAVDLGDAIVFKWTGIPNALGLHAQVMGMNMDAKTMTIWTSSEEKPDWGVSFDYLQMAEVKSLVEKQIVMAGDRVEVTVPAAIFKDADMVMMQMIGYGPGAALGEGQPIPRVQTKTTLSIMLGGKKMPKGGFGPNPAGEP